MASLEFLIRTDVSGLTPLFHNGVPIVSVYSKISEFFPDKTMATLLAEPGLSEYTEESGYIDVRWYSTAQGNRISYAKADIEEKENMGAKIRDVISALSRVLSGASEKTLLLYALLVPSKDDIYIINGDLVLVNWGFVPKTIGTDEASLRNHFQSIYGEFCEIDQVWPLQNSIPKSGVAALSPQQARPEEDPEQIKEKTASSNVPPPLPPQKNETSLEKRRFSAGFFVFMALLMILIGLLLGWFTSDYYEPGAWPKGSDALAAQTELNKSLRRERDDLTEILKTSICDNNDVQSILDPGQDDIKRLPGDVNEMTTDGGPPIPSTLKVAELLENSAVMVLSPLEKGLSMGTGFLISKTHIVTNRHVIDGNNSKKVMIVNKKIGKAVEANIIAQSNTKERDYAVLELTQEIPMQPMIFASDVAKLSKVFTGGYPGFFTRFDPALAKLFEGDLQQAPEMIMSSGEVSVVQKPPGGVPFIVHTADLSQGNSGGPLIDRCGRVVGINTYISDDPESGRRANFSLSSADLMAFLTEQNIQYKKSNETCQPVQ